MPFLKLTRDRRGYEHTFLLHADTPGERPRVLYWYRTAPGVLIGRPALDEEAIRHIEEQHPLIEFDWPAILALREAMPPEDEAGAPRPERRERRPSRRDSGGRGRESGRDSGRESRGPARPPAPTETLAPTEAAAADAARDALETPADDAGADTADEVPTTRGLLEELVGREIATRLRARHAEIMARIHEQAFDASTLAAWVARADALDPDTWLTPDAILAGVRDADAAFERLRQSLLAGE